MAAIAFMFSGPLLEQRVEGCVVCDLNPPAAKKGPANSAVCRRRLQEPSRLIAQSHGTSPSARELPRARRLGRSMRRSTTDCNEGPRQRPASGEEQPIVKTGARQRTTTFRGHHDGVLESYAGATANARHPDERLNCERHVFLKDDCLRAR
jgi:hypothetical protein